MTWYVDIGLWFWGLFKLWAYTLFAAPFKHSDMLWLLIPIWITWFFAEFFQEKQGTSMGNAITNSVVVIWGSIDLTRQTVNFIKSGVLTSLWEIIGRFFTVAVILTYGVIIVVLGLKGKKVIKYIGRVREVTYAFAIFAPVFYNAVPFTMNHVLAAIFFFPLFYYVIEFLDRYTPNPKAVKVDLDEKKDSGDDIDKGFDNIGGFDSGSKKGKKDDDILGELKI